MYVVCRAAALAACALALGAQPVAAQTKAASTPDWSSNATRGVYAASNAIGGNSIAAYRVAHDGTITLLANYPTGGKGVGAQKLPTLTANPIDPLTSNASLRYAPDHRALLAVNAGSGSISAFKINPDATLTLRDVKPSGGTFPNTIAAFGTIVYVANVGNPANGIPATLSGFQLDSDAHLAPIPGSTRTLSQPATSQPATAVFSPDGHFLVVADLGADRITTFAIKRNGVLGEPVSTLSVGGQPFGAVFHGGALLVSEAQSGVPGAATVSSYRLLDDGHVVAIAAAVPSGGTAGCWLISRAATAQVFVANTASGTISSYVQGAHGELALLASVAAPAPATPMSGPVDLGLSEDGHYLYQLYDAIGTIAVYQTSASGKLKYISSAKMSPATGTQGLVVY